MSLDRPHVAHALIGVALCLLAASPATALDGAAERGQSFAKENCARCHAVDVSGASPLKVAPPFVDLAKNFPIDDLADVLAEGVERRHPAMPDFRFDPTDASNLTAYLKTLRR